MASRRALERAVRRLRMDSGDVDRLAEKLLTTKRRVYRRTLDELARKLGYSTTGLPKLSEEVLSGLGAESEDHARRIVETFNRDLEQEGTRLGDIPSAEIEARLRTWAVARQRKRATPTAITEAYSAHADATMSAYLDLGLPESVLLDFGGHPELGDKAPVCDICIALIRGNPWTLAEVVQIGNPHVACRQQWHLHDVDQRELPPQLPDLGQTLAGVVGRDNLLSRHGNKREQAVEFIDSLSE